MPAETVHAIRASDLTEDTKAKLIDIFARSAAAKPELDAKLTAIADEFLGGAKLGKNGGILLLAPLKGADRTIAKVTVDHQGDPTRMKDILRATLIASDLGQARAVIDATKARFETTGKDRDLLRPDADASKTGGYRDAKFNIAINGITAEVQVSIPEMVAAKAEVHHNYAAAEKIARKAKGEERSLTAEGLGRNPAADRRSARGLRAGPDFRPRGRHEPAERLWGHAGPVAQHGVHGEQPRLREVPGHIEPFDAGNLADGHGDALHVVQLDAGRERCGNIDHRRNLCFGCGQSGPKGPDHASHCSYRTAPVSTAL